MPARIQVAILENHQSIIDGYLYRLAAAPGIEVAGYALYGEHLQPLLREHPVDVLILDVIVPVSAENPQPFPILHTISMLLARYPNLRLLVISMLADPAIIRTLAEAGIRGYIIKDDYQSIQQLGTIITTIASGGVYFSQEASQWLKRETPKALASPMSDRQLEALSLCAAYPDCSMAQLADKMGVAHSTFRNLLSDAYNRLGVRTRAGAVIKAQQMGIITAKSDRG